MTRFHRAFPVLLMLPLALSISGCGDDSTMNPNDGAITIPASWGGTWQITSQPVTRGLGSSVEIQPLCSGAAVEDLFADLGELGLGTLECAGAWTDTDADVQCSTSLTLQGCTLTATLILDVTRSGETFMGTQTVSVASDPPDCALPDTSLTMEVTGQRLSLEQFGCATDLERYAPAGWGGVWQVTETPLGREAGGMQVCPARTSAEDFFYPSTSASTTGGFRDGSAEVFGSWSEPAGVCLSLISEKISVTRNGDTLTGIREQTVRTVDYPDLPGDCSGTTVMQYQISGTRTSTDTSPCSLGQAASLRELRPEDFLLF